MSNTTYATSPEAREAHEKMTKRISALIAKAESTTSPEEAAVFMAKAEELMLKHAIDRAKLEQLGKLAKEDIGVTYVPFVGAPKRYWSDLGRMGGWRVANALGLTGAAVSPHTESIILYGTASDAAQVRSMIESVWRQAAAFLALFKKTDPQYLDSDRNERRLLAKSYLRGFVAGYCTAIEAAREATAGATTGSELVLVNRRAEIQDFMAQQGLRKGRASYARNSSSGFAAGYRDGVSAERGRSVTR